jgi:hypothetical protein
LDNVPRSQAEGLATPSQSVAAHFSIEYLNIIATLTVGRKKMARSEIHREIAAISGDNPAGYITIAPLARLTLSQVVSAAGLLKGKLIAAGSGRLSATLRDIVWARRADASLVAARNPVNPDGELDVLITSNFDVLVDIFITGDESKRISELSITISNARAHIRAENNLIVIEGSEFLTRMNINRLDRADELLAADGIDLLEAARVEGHIGYGVVSQAVGNALGQRRELSLATVFPAVDFGRSIKLKVLDNGKALGIIPTETVRLISSAHCICQEGPDFEVTRTAIENTAPPDPRPNDEIGKVKIGGPLPDNKDPFHDFAPRAADREGLAGLYIPQTFAQTLTVEVMPAIKLVASDQGTIGYRAEANVGFKNFRVSIDVPGGGIILDIDLDISVSAYVDFEIFKGVRLPIGWAIIMPAQGSNATVQLGFYPSVDKSGTIRLRSTLKKADMGNYVAVVIGIGTALEFIGVTAWIGFLIDVVLATILSLGLPIALKKAISDYLANKEWKLIDGLPVADPTADFHPLAPFDSLPSSILASFDFRG